MRTKGLFAPPTFALAVLVCLQTRAVGVVCRVGCVESVDAELRLRVAGALISVIARPWGVLEVCEGGGGGMFTLSVPWLFDT